MFGDSVGRFGIFSYTGIMNDRFEFNMFPFLYPLYVDFDSLYGASTFVIY